MTEYLMNESVLTGNTKYRIHRPFFGNDKIILQVDFIQYELTLENEKIV